MVDEYNDNQMEAIAAEEMQQKIDMLTAFQKDALLFVRIIFKVEPTPQQVLILKAISKPGAKVSVKSGHGTGKSTVFAWVSMWHVFCFPDSKCPCTAPASNQLNDVLWAEISKWHARAHPWVRDAIEITKDRVEMRENPKTQFAVARTARKEKPEALQGFHATNLLFLIDEASGVHQSIFEVAEGALSTPDARVLMAANPTQVVGYFYDSQNRMAHRFECITLNGEDSPMVSKEYIEDMEAKYGKDSDIYRVRVLGEFPQASVSQLIGEELYELAIARSHKPEQFNFAPRVLGADVAWEGDDRSCVYFRQGIFSKRLGTWRGINNMELASIIVQYIIKYEIDATFIDIGWGAGVIDRLKQLRYDPIGVNFGSKAQDKDRYADRRTEMWCRGRDWLEDGGSLEGSDELREDLMGPEYFFLPSGKIKLESKKEMKKRGLSSPDVGDALMLTFAENVHRRGGSKSTLHFAKSDYDPLSSPSHRDRKDRRFANNEYDLFS